MIHLLLALVLSSPAIAYRWDITRCAVSTPIENDKELTDGENREAICNESIFALRGIYGDIEEGYALKISAKTENRNSLMLWIDWTTPYTGNDYHGRAMLFWSPDGRYVQFLDKPDWVKR